MMIPQTRTPQVAVRTAVVASGDAAFRERVAASLSKMRWQVREVGGGAEAMESLEESGAEALLVDTWLPDLDAGEFVSQMHAMYPAMDLLRSDGSADGVGVRSPRRNELLHALREAQAAAPTDGAAWAAAPVRVPESNGLIGHRYRGTAPGEWDLKRSVAPREVVTDDAVLIPEMVGTSAPMRELARLIRLVAPQSATVLIEGETGAGKEVVANAIHRLSERNARPFVVLNCAAIPEALLEAELFGHARGAFTGAVQARRGRIETADGGTLFLDEIGEMPLALQAKMLRFLECGELQRVGDNDVTRVDVRVIAATHQALEQCAAAKTFRLDLYHRLAVFPLEVPPLRSRAEDLPLLAAHILRRLSLQMPMKRLTPEAALKLQMHAWPGNVRELAHVLERAAILSAERSEIGVGEIRFGRANG